MADPSPWRFKDEWLARTCLDLPGVTLEVRSELGKGSRFTISLPA